MPEILEILEEKNVIDDHLLDIIGNEFKFSHEKGLSEWLKNSADARMNTKSKRDGLSGDKIALLEEMRKRVFDHNRQIYIVSLTSESDSLSQWRAYCPITGGYAIGLPSGHLRNLGADQGFYLAPCLYKNADQQRLVNEIIDYYLRLLAN